MNRLMVTLVQVVEEILQSELIRLWLRVKHLRDRLENQEIRKKNKTRTDSLNPRTSISGGAS